MTKVPCQTQTVPMKYPQIRVCQPLVPSSGQNALAIAPPAENVVEAATS